MANEPAPSPLKVVAFLDAPRAWIDQLPEADITVVVKPLEELTVTGVRNVTADALLIEIDALPDEQLLPVLAASQSCVQIGLTAGLPDNRIRAVELLLDRVAPVKGSSTVIGWTIKRAYDHRGWRHAVDPPGNSLNDWRYQSELVALGPEAEVDQGFSTAESEVRPQEDVISQASGPLWELRLLLPDDELLREAELN